MSNMTATCYNGAAARRRCTAPYLRRPAARNPALCGVFRFHQERPATNVPIRRPGKSVLHSPPGGRRTRADRYSAGFGVFCCPEITATVGRFPVRVEPDRESADYQLPEGFCMLCLSEMVSLSPRELEVLALIAGGCTRRQVALQLTISPKTVDTHMRRIFRKLEAVNAVQAALVAQQQLLQHVAA